MTRTPPTNAVTRRGFAAGAGAAGLLAATAPLDQDRCFFHGRLLVNFDGRDWAAPW